MRTVLTLLAIACSCSACGGRAHLSDEFGSATQQLFQAQAVSHPRQALSPMTANEAHAIMANYGARYNASKANSAATSGFGLNTSTSGVSQFSLGNSSSDGFNTGSIKLKAK